MVEVGGKYTYNGYIGDHKVIIIITSYTFTTSMWLKEVLKEGNTRNDTLIISLSVDELKQLWIETMKIIQICTSSSCFIMRLSLKSLNPSVTIDSASKENQSPVQLESLISVKSSALVKSVPTNCATKDSQTKKSKVILPVRDDFGYGLKYVKILEEKYKIEISNIGIHSKPERQNHGDVNR